MASGTEIFVRWLTAVKRLSNIIPVFRIALTLEDPKCVKSVNSTVNTQTTSKVSNTLLNARSYDD